MKSWWSNSAHNYGDHCKTEPDPCKEYVLRSEVEEEISELRDRLADRSHDMGNLIDKMDKSVQREREEIKAGVRKLASRWPGNLAWSEVIGLIEARGKKGEQKKCDHRYVRIAHTFGTKTARVECSECGVEQKEWHTSVSEGGTVSAYIVVDAKKEPKPKGPFIICPKCHTSHELHLLCPEPKGQIE